MEMVDIIGAMGVLLSFAFTASLCCIKLLASKGWWVGLLGLSWAVFMFVIVMRNPIWL